MISIVMYILTMLYVLYTYYNRVNDLVIEVHTLSRWGILVSHVSSGFLAECPRLAGRIQCALVRGQRAFSQNSSDLSDADANAVGGESGRDGAVVSVTSFQLCCMHAFHLADPNPAFMYALHFISRFGLFRSACR